MIATLRANSSFTGANIDRISEAADDFLLSVLNYLEHKTIRFLKEKHFDQDADAQ